MAAGLGFKTFTTGEVLTAADVNGYLMQGVLVFATEAARNSAITSPQEGQFAFTKDTNSLWYYSGSAWVASGATGDIEGVTAGTGISGGGTSGTVTITNSMATEITAKADLIVGTGNAAFDNLAVGADGTVLTADSNVSPTGLKWAAPASGAPLVAGKNRIINGNMAIAQRRQTFTSTNGQNNDDAYTLDRWYLLTDGNDAVDVTRATEAPTNGQFSIGLDVETANKKFGIAQIIEQRNCYGLIGQTVTLSFKAKVSATTKLDNVKAAIVAWSGTADTVTSDIISAWNVEGTNPTLIANATYENSPANLSVTTSWASYSISAAVDTASTKNILVFIWSDVTDTTAGDFLYITDVQLEKGSSASDFTLSTGTVTSEIQACQRYYEKTYELDTAPGTDTYEGHQLISGSTDGGAQIYHTPRFQVRKRGVPTISTFTNDGVSGQWGYARNGASANVTASVIRISDNGALIFAAIGANFVAATWAGHWVAELEM